MLTLRPKLSKCIDAYEYSSGNAATVRNVEAKGLSLRSTILPALYFNCNAHFRSAKAAIIISAYRYVWE